MEFGCSLCGYTSFRKNDVIKHFSRKKSCGSGIKEIIEIPIKLECKYCHKDFSSFTSLTFHTKNNCKYKNSILEQQLKEANIKNKELEIQLKESQKSKQSIRTDARKIYKQKYEHLACIHCKNKEVNNIQICHIKAVRDFSLTDSIKAINDLSNLISLCANCHLDFDKTKKFKVSRTVLLHSFIVKHLQSYEDFKLL